MDLKDFTNRIPIHYQIIEESQTFQTPLKLKTISIKHEKEKNRTAQNNLQLSKNNQKSFWF